MFGREPHAVSQAGELSPRLGADALVLVARRGRGGQRRHEPGRIDRAPAAGNVEALGGGEPGGEDGLAVRGGRRWVSFDSFGEGGLRCCWPEYSVQRRGADAGVAIVYFAGLRVRAGHTGGGSAW